MHMSLLTYSTSFYCTEDSVHNSSIYQRYVSLCNIMLKQECIPVGCILITSVAISCIHAPLPSMPPLPHMPPCCAHPCHTCPLPCTSPAMHALLLPHTPPCHTCPPPVDRITDDSENITFTNFVCVL